MVAYRLLLSSLYQGQESEGLAAVLFEPKIIFSVTDSHSMSFGFLRTCLCFQFNSVT